MLYLTMIPQKAREKEIKKLEEKREKQLAKLKKKGNRSGAEEGRNRNNSFGAGRDGRKE